MAVAFDEVRDEIAALQPTDLGADAAPHAFSVAHRLTLALAGGAWAGVCAEGAPTAITSDPLIRLAGLNRIERGSAAIACRPSTRSSSTDSWSSPQTGSGGTSACPLDPDDSPPPAAWKEGAP